MMKRAVSILGLLGMLLVPCRGEAASSAFIYTGWLPFWKQENGALDVARSLEKLSSISPFSYEVRSGGRIVDKLEIDEGVWPGWLSAVRDMKIKIIPTRVIAIVLTEEC